MFVLADVELYRDPDRVLWYRQVAVWLEAKTNDDKSLRLFRVFCGVVSVFGIGRLHPRRI